VCASESVSHRSFVCQCCRHAQCAHLPHNCQVMIFYTPRREMEKKGRKNKNPTSNEGNKRSIFSRIFPKPPDFSIHWGEPHSNCPIVCSSSLLMIFALGIISMLLKRHFVVPSHPKPPEKPSPFTPLCFIVIDSFIRFFFIFLVSSYPVPVPVPFA